MHGSTAQHNAAQRTTASVERPSGKATSNMTMRRMWRENKEKNLNGKKYQYQHLHASADKSFLVTFRRIQGVS